MVYAITENSGANKAARGFTLTEMLVVLAIVVTLTAIAIPAFIRFGALTGNQVDNTAFELQAFLRAARTHAITHNTDTAVAYFVNAFEVEPGVEIPYIDGAVVARKVRPNVPEDQEILNTLGMNGATNVYTPVESRRGEFRPFTEGTCIKSSALTGDTGLKPILLVNITRDENGAITGVAPVAPRPGRDFGAPGSAYFPAHCFKAAGYVDSASSRARFELEVGFTPQRVEEEGDRTAKVELFATMGRAKYAG